MLATSPHPASRWWKSRTRRGCNWRLTCPKRLRLRFSQTPK
jgi:hypothetical protein